jgi:uncharacterized protein YjbI with pentapeptide repeats
MGKIVEFLSIKPRTTDHRQGLRKLSPDLISKARDATASQVTRIGLTFVGTTAFCLLSLLSPDSALLGGGDKINVPFAGPVSFFGFILLGPAVLVMLRVYLQIYVEHGNRLDRLARSVPVARAPTLVPLQNPLIRLFSVLIFYLLLPVAIVLFAWKAAAFPDWTPGLFGVAVGVIASHVMLLPPFSRLTWRRRASLIAGAATLALGLISGLGPLRRPFDLERANLSGQWLVGDNLTSANLWRANLAGANLDFADLTRADLREANLSNASLVGTSLTGANLEEANMTGANLNLANNLNLNAGEPKPSNIDLIRANLTGAQLTIANLTGANLSSAVLSSAYLSGANLTGANLNNADLTRADLSNADLTRADLTFARLSGANLDNADLTGANMGNAELRGTENLTQMQLDDACGNAGTKLPEGLTLKPCPTDQ